MSATDRLRSAVGSLELARFGRGRLPRAAMVAVVLLPLLYGALYVWSMWDPYGKLDKLPVAVVNEDRPAAGGSLHAGDDLVRELQKRHVFAWQPASAARAETGLKKGDYYLTLTIPKDFSARLAANGGKDPAASALRVRTNDSNSYLAGIIGKSAFKEIRAAGSAKASRSYYDKIFVSFADLHRQTAKAADGADELTGGARKAHDGSSKLADGATELGDGLATAKDGAGRLSSGLGKASTGSAALSKGIGRLHDGAVQAAAGTGKLNRMVQGHGDAVDLLKRRPAEVKATARTVSLAAAAVRDNADKLPGLTGAARTTSAQAAAAADTAYTKLCSAEPGTAATAAAGKAQPDPAGCAALKTARDAARQAAADAKAADAYVSSQNLKQIAQDAGTVEKYADELAVAAPHLGNDLASAVSDVNRLDQGVKALSTGSAKLSAGAGDLHSGIVTAHGGAQSLDGGLTKLQGGAGDLHGGLVSLKDGLGTLQDGSGTLADGLHDGAKQIPAYGKADRDHRSEVLSDPVSLAMQHLNKTANYGTGFAPYFMPLALWVGVMVGYMLLRPLNSRLLSANAPASRTWLAGYLPSLALAVPQLAVLTAVLHFGLGMEIARPAALLGFLLLVCAAFAAVLQFLNARFGPAGRVLGLALLMVQITSAGGTYPVQTSPGFFNAVHSWLPMSWAVEALRRLISGGDPAVVWQACAVLGAYTVVFSALTVLTARKKQMWSMSRLHPELTL